MLITRRRGDCGDAPPRAPRLRVNRLPRDGYGLTFVTVNAPFAFVTTRIGATTRPRADVKVVVDDAVVLVVAGVVVVA